MSCFIYGYLEHSNHKDLNSIINLIENMGLGIFFDAAIKMHNFPVEYLPKDSSIHVNFELGGKPGTNDSTMLLWEDDLDPHHSYGKIPYKFKDRLELIVSVFELLIEYFNATKIAVAITDSCQIEKVTVCEVSKLRVNFFTDCSVSSPPDVLYVAIPERPIVSSD